MGWVDPWVGLSWVGSGGVEIFQFLVGWVGSTIAKVLKKFTKINYVNAFKPHLDKIQLNWILRLG